MTLYYLDEEHQELTQEFLERIGLKDVHQDIEYGVFCYLAGTTGKSELLKYCDKKGIKVQQLLDNAVPHSSTEINFLKLGLHLFNDNFGRDLTIRSLDNQHRKVAYTALQLRYGA